MHGGDCAGCNGSCPECDENAAEMHRQIADLTRRLGMVNAANHAHHVSADRADAEIARLEKQLATAQADERKQWRDHLEERKALAEQQGVDEIAERAQWAIDELDDDTKGEAEDGR